MQTDNSEPLHSHSLSLSSTCDSEFDDDRHQWRKRTLTAQPSCFATQWRSRRRSSKLRCQTRLEFMSVALRCMIKATLVTLELASLWCSLQVNYLVFPSLSFQFEWFMLFWTLCVFFFPSGSRILSLNLASSNCSWFQGFLLTENFKYFWLQLTKMPSALFLLS